jgi:hypothetical protein
MRVRWPANRLGADEQRTVLRLLGLLSIVSGGALIFAPLKLAAVYGLPRSVALARLIGLRDIAIGLGILKLHETNAWFVAARGASDALDTVLIALQGMHIKRTCGTAVRIPVALISSSLAWSLAQRRSP